MAQQKKSFITRMLEGKEKSEEYARSTLPTNRWQLFFDIFKGNFGKLVKINLLMLLFFIPTILVIAFAWMMGETSGVLYPFGANLGVGYPAVPIQQGLAESLRFQNDILIYGLVAVSAFFAAIGIAGGMYVMRNMVWTEGVFVANDFWRGVKLNYKNALQSALFFTLILFLMSTVVNMADLTIAVGGISKVQTVFLTISKVLSYAMVVLSALMTFWMIALGVNYKQSFFVMVKNSFLITVATIPQSVFFAVLALLPFALFLINVGLFTTVAILIVIFFGLSYALLVWLDFAQWVFDKYINPKIEGAKVGRGIYGRGGQRLVDNGDAQSALEYQRIILAAGKSQLVAKPIKPIDDDLRVYDLPTSFTREDLKRLRESKETIVEDSAAYAEEHKNDEKYVEYNRQFEERERAIQEADAGKKKKKKKFGKLLGDE